VTAPDRSYGAVWRDACLLVEAGCDWERALRATGDAAGGYEALLPGPARPLFPPADERGARLDLARVVADWETCAPPARTWKAFGHLVPAGVPVEPLAAALDGPAWSAPANDEVRFVRDALVRARPERLDACLRTLRELGATGLPTPASLLWARLALLLEGGASIGDAFERCLPESSRPKGAFDPVRDSLEEQDFGFQPDAVEIEILRVASIRGRPGPAFSALARRRAQSG